MCVFIAVHRYPVLTIYKLGILATYDIVVVYFPRRFSFVLMDSETLARELNQRSFFEIIKCHAQFWYRNDQAHWLGNPA